MVRSFVFQFGEGGRPINGKTRGRRQKTSKGEEEEDETEEEEEDGGEPGNS